MSINLQAVGLPTAPRHDLFPSQTGLFDRPSPGSYEPGSFSHAFSPLRSFFASPPGYLFRRNLVCQGFLPSSRHRRSRLLVREHTLSRYVPPSGFLNLSTACSASGFVGLLHPTATCRVLSVQGFLPIRSRPDSSPGVPPCRYRSDCSPPRRLPHSGGSTSRLCSANRSVLRGRGLAALSVAPLFGFHLPQAWADPS
jgi:hypothetical protein